MTSSATIQLTIQKNRQGNSYLFIPQGVKNVLRVFEVPVLGEKSDEKKRTSSGENQRISPETALTRAFNRWHAIYDSWEHYEKGENINSNSPVDLAREEESDEFVGPKEAEEKLADYFRDWLNQRELLPLWDAIRDTVPSRSGPVEVLLACECGDDDILYHLPWRRFYLDTDRICLVRTVAPRPMDPTSLPNDSALSKPRTGIKVLQVIAHEPHNLKTQKQLLAHRTCLDALKKTKNVTVISLTPHDYNTPKEFKDAFFERLREGPDILIFSGHGEQKVRTDGEIHFGNGIKINVSRYEPEFRDAIAQGLKVAIFIACHTYHFARALVEIGLQHAIAMRAKIHAEAGGIFLKQLCECLGQYATLQRAMDHACDHLATQHEKHPSAHLIPSRFLHPQATPFQLEPSRFNRWWMAWKPTPRETIALATLLTLSTILPVQERLYNGRTGVQAALRGIAALPAGNPTSDAKPPVLLVTVDQESVNDARNRFNDFSPNPMHRGYLAELVTQLAQAQAQVVGIDYLFKDPTRQDQKLIDAMQQAAQRNQTQFVLAQSEYSQLEPLKKIALPEITLPGNIDFWPWEVELTKASPLDASVLPFSQLLVLLKQSQPPSSTLAAAREPGFFVAVKASLRQRLDQSLRSKGTNPMPGIPPHPVGWIVTLLGLQNWIDFSLSPNQIYTEITAKDLPNKVTNPTFREQLKQQVVMVIPGGYEKQDPEDLESVPLAVRYWSNLHPILARQPPRRGDRLASDQFPLGKAHAYMVYQIQHGHFIYAPHNGWFILLTAVVARWANLTLIEAKARDQQWRFLKVLLAVYLSSVVLILLCYFWPGVALPIALPSLLLGFNLFPTVKPILTARRSTYVEITCPQEPPINPS